MALVGKQEINKVEVEIHANSSGIWYVTLPSEEDGKRGTELGNSSNNLEQAIAKARVSINKMKVKLNVPFVTPEGKRGYATGKHARTRKILTVINGEKVHLDHYSRVLKPDTPTSETDRLKEIEQRIKSLTDERGEIFAEWQFDLGKEVERQIEAGVEQPA